jgi:glycosyltransferase involved in cell wall biosynthesis
MDTTDVHSGPVRLLVFAHALQGRGTERAIVRLLGQLDRSKVVPELAIASARGEFLASVPDDVVLHDLHIGDRRTIAALPALERLVRARRPDCALGVHISAGRVLAALRLVHPRLPVICMEADPFTRIEGGKGNLAVRKTLSRFTYRLATHIVAAADVVADDLVEHLGVSREKITLIPLPSVDHEIPALAAEPLTDPPFDGDEDVVVTIGNMFPHKDQATLLRAFAEIARSQAAHLVLIGDGPVRSDLERLAGDLGIADRTSFVGFQRNPFKYLARSSVYVSPSAAEGFDISQIEAMACGLPVVVTDAPRFRAVEDGRTGLLVPPGDPHRMAAAVLSLLRDGDLASELGRNAREAAKEYTSARIARRYEELIGTVVGRTR